MVCVFPALVGPARQFVVLVLVDCIRVQHLCITDFAIYLCVWLAEGETIHHDFLKAIEVPLRNEEHITFGTGTDGFPAFILFHGHDIKIPHKLLLPDKLYSDFSILVTVKPENEEGK